MKSEKVSEKILAKIAYKTAESVSNKSCAFLFNQPKLPEKVKKLRKF